VLERQKNSSQGILTSGLLLFSDGCARHGQSLRVENPLRARQQKAPAEGRGGISAVTGGQNFGPLVDGTAGCRMVYHGSPGESPPDLSETGCRHAGMDK